MAAAGGAASGAVATGNLRGAVNGALSGMLFYGIGSYYQSQNGAWAHVGGDTNAALTTAGWASRSVAYGAAGGIMSELEGDKFGHGFVAAGLTESMSGYVNGSQRLETRVIAATLVGGTASRLSGGKFANGAVTAAFSYALSGLANHTAGSSRKDLGRKLTEEEIALSNKAQIAAFRKDEIDYSNARIVKGRFVFFQFSNYAITINETIYYPGDCGNLAICGDSAEEIEQNGYLISHEMEHIHQYQQGINVLWKALPLQIGKFVTFGLYNPYTVPISVPYERMNVEQKADFVAGHLYPNYVRYK